MIAYLLKNWKLFLDIIIVVGAIIALALVDPFGMFSKRGLKGTANLVSSVQSIGELVTAEYYGEVISSLNETYIFNLEPDTIEACFENCFIELKGICNDYRKKKADENKTISFIQRVIRHYRSASSIVDLPGYKKMIEKYQKEKVNVYSYLIPFLGVHLLDKDEKKFYKVNNGKIELYDNAAERIVQAILDDIKAIEQQKRVSEEEKEEQVRKYIYDIPEYFEGAERFFYGLNQTLVDKKRKKKDIIFIGRGWVKAGFKFDKLDKRNFIYDKGRKRLTFYGLYPMVLSQDINPWFIPEKRIKGFDLISYYKGASFEEAKAVKIKCKQKLLEQAESAGLLVQAKENGQEALQSFFSLLLNEPNLSVEFKEMPHQHTVHMFLADTLLTVNEALEIDTILQEYRKKISQSISPQKEKLVKEMRIFYNQLEGKPFLNKKYAFNLYAIEAAKVLEHKYYVSYADYLHLKDSVRKKLLLARGEKQDVIHVEFFDKDSLKTGYPDFVKQFNSAMLCVQEQVEEAIKDTSLTVEITNADRALLNTKKDTLHDIFECLPTNKMFKKETVYMLKRKNSTLSYDFMDLAYPDFSMPKGFTDTLRYGDLDLIKPYLEKQIENFKNKSRDSLLNTIRKEELEQVILPYEHKRVKNQILLRPVNKAISWINRN
jgi:hypothetical protein